MLPATSREEGTQVKGGGRKAGMCPFAQFRVESHGQKGAPRPPTWRHYGMPVEAFQSLGRRAPGGRLCRVWMAKGL